MLPADAAAARLAATQHRVITTQQLRECGLDRNAVAHRVKRRGLRRLWHGVYLLGPDPPGALSLAQAALLTVRSNGVISHYWAGYLWGFLPLPSLPVDVTITSGSHRGRREVLVHRTILTHPSDFSTRNGLPITSPARTLLDLAALLGPHELERAVAEAQVLKLVTEAALRAICARAGRHPGVDKLRRVLDTGPALTRSEAERVLRRLLRAARLPEPLVNVKVGRYEVDFLWPAQEVIVEVDGYAFHGHRAAFERDSRRRAELAAAGYAVLPVTWRQLTEEPHAVVATIAAALAQSSSRTAGEGEFARRASDSMPVAGSGREK